MANIKQLLRRRHPSLHWETFDREGQKVVELFASLGAKSLIRAGDGEAKILNSGRRIALGGYLARAIKYADCFGVIHQNKEYQSAVLQALSDLYKVQVDPSKQIYSTLFWYVPEYVGQLAKDKRVLWITSGADIIVKNLGDPAFRDFYLLHDIAHNSYINAMSGVINSPYPKNLSAEQLSDFSVPPSPAPEEEDFDLSYVPASWKTPCHHMASVEQSYLHIRHQLTQVPDFDLALVGAGVVGKLVCHHIKTALSKTAIDIGAFMSPLQGSTLKGSELAWGKIDPKLLNQSPRTKQSI